MSAYCGPTNALQKLSNHQQVDRSLHQDFSQQQRNQQQNSFRQQNHNAQLEREFQQQFNPVLQNAFQNAPMHRMNQSNINSNQTGSSSWANDFANLSLNGGQQGRVQQNQRSNWSSQFVAQQPIQQHHIQHEQHTGLYQPGFNQLQTNYTRQQLLPQQQYRTEHQEVHAQQEQFHNDLESEFSKLEQEFKQREQVTVQEPVSELPLPSAQNEEFKKAATTISNIMQNTSMESSNKFANSNFLKLMQMVSNGKVSLNEEETKLVDEQGNDIHEEKMAQEQEQEQQKQGLPDPLEGLSAADLTSAFEGAQRVGELHNEQYTWDDIYVDYKNDDDSF